ncbi:hypothetical protein LINGRAPRIM_LOCUS2477 [Linum grandiflorum]
MAPRRQMKILAWNVQGLGSSLTSDSLGAFWRQKLPSILFLCETKNNKTRVQRKVQKLTGLESGFIVDPIGKSGGLGLFWNSSFSGVLREVTNFCIAMDFDYCGIKVTIIGVYLDCSLQIRIKQFEFLWYLCSNINQPFILCGDFNAILLHSEKLSPHNSHSNSLASFQSFVSQLELHDIHPLVPFFTWTNKQTPETLVRLDRFLASSDWCRLFPEGTVTNLSDVGSDYRAILYLPHRLSAPPCYFNFNNRWTTNPEAKDIIQNVWASSNPPGSCLFRLIQNWQQLAMHWSIGKN